MDTNDGQEEKRLKGTRLRVWREKDAPDYSDNDSQEGKSGEDVGN